MGSYTLEEATAFFDAAKAAYLNALTNRKYDVGSRSKENQSIADLKKNMDFWALEVAKIGGALPRGPRVKRVVPIA